MATWEQKMPPLHHDASSLWSIKSSTTSDAWPPPSGPVAAAGAAGGVESSPEAGVEQLPTSQQPGSLMSSRSFMDTLSGRHLFSNASTSSDMEASIQALSPGEFQLQSSFDQQQQQQQQQKQQHQRQSSSSLGPVGGGGGGVAGAGGSAGPCKSENTDSQAGTKSGTSPSGRLLNGPASVGTSSTKVTKKRARASRKPPTTVLEADSANFRAMVQQLTGIPAVPFLSPSAAGRGGLEFLNLVRPPPVRSFLGQGLPPLSNASFHFATSPLSRGQGRGQVQLLHSDPAFAVPYSKNMFMRSQDQSRQASMGDFLRTPMEELSQELGLDRSTLEPLAEQQHQRQSQHLQPALAVKLAGPGGGTSMPVLWDGSDVREAEGPLQMDPLTKFKLGRSAGGGADADEADIDSWLDQNAEAR